MNIQLLVLRYVVTVGNVHFCALSKTTNSAQASQWWQSTERHCCQTLSGSKRHCSQTLISLPQSK